MSPDTATPPATDQPPETAEAPTEPARRIDMSLVVLIIAMAVAGGFLIGITIVTAASGHMSLVDYWLGFMTAAICAFIGRAVNQLIREAREAQ